MSFSETWLTLRAGFDAAARSRALEDRLANWATTRTLATGRPLAVVDLGAGSGNNRRHLAPRLPAGQAWTLVDADGALLAAAARNDPAVAVRQADLAAELEAALPDGTDLVTASALIDLVSAEWLQRLVARVEALGAALLVVLTYDGRTAWQPADPLDSRVLELVNRHQRSDKGFGPALGPDAGPALARLCGGRLVQASSDWAIGPGDDAMRAALVEGWAAAAIELSPGEAGGIAAWRDRSIGRAARLTVGHLDQLVLPD
ncbi:methyltransferase domain-containing protein [Thalassobaculum sp.]|uniref:methyltransferase domain-containing protein n=1 Tax=Thalassobaculum sp. TaxID=2022740 RepID=UPI0032F0957C